MVINIGLSLWLSHCVSRAHFWAFLFFGTLVNLNEPKSRIQQTLHLLHKAEKYNKSNGSSHDNRVLHPLHQWCQKLVPADIQPHPKGHLTMCASQQLGGLLRNINRHRRCLLRDQRGFQPACQYLTISFLALCRCHLPTILLEKLSKRSLQSVMYPASFEARRVLRLVIHSSKTPTLTATTTLALVHYKPHQVEKKHSAPPFAKAHLVMMTL